MGQVRNMGGHGGEVINKMDSSSLLIIMMVISISLSFIDALILSLINIEYSLC